MQLQSMEQIFYNTSLTYGDPENQVPEDAYLFYLCWDVTGLLETPVVIEGDTTDAGEEETSVTKNGLDQAFCFSNASW